MIYIKKTKFNPIIKIILVIFLFCIYSFTNAQTLTVYKFEEDKTDLEAYYNEVKDINGEKCALIKVLINNIDIYKILFETKGIEVKKIEKKPPTQIWVYVSPQTQGLVITTAGYGNINYYDFPTGPLKSTKTYIMDLRTDIKLKLVEEKIEEEFVILKISPEDKGVEVWIDGIKKGLTPLQTTPTLKPGIHQIKLIKNLYHNLDTNINVVFNGGNSFNFTLKPKFGKLKINSINEITDCQVLLNEEERCTTLPCTIDKIKSGTQHLVIKKDLYADFNENFEMTDGAFKIIDNLTLKPIYATINLRTNPSNAAIYINKNNVSNKGELKNYKVNSGNYFIEAKLKNYKDFQKNIILKEQENYTETIQLEPQVGSISIETDPIECEIYLNGIKQNRLTPVVLRNIQVGSYQLELKKEGFTSIKKLIEIKEGETNKVIEKLIAGITIPIITEPSNASIEIDGIYLGISPISYKFTIGKNYNIKITKENYKPINETIFITENVNKLPVYNLEKLEKILPIITEPTNATIEIDGKFIGISPISYKFTIGKNYNIKITKENYKPINETIFVPENINKLPVYNLEKLEKNLPIITEPSNARIYIDDNYIGISPISYKFTIGKNYNIKITKENYKPINETIFITENVNKLPIYNLEKLEKILPIITEPSNARIYIDDNYIGISPISYKFTIGKTYNLKITKENYKPINETIFITENTNKLPVYNLEKLEKNLPIITEPSNASIEIDGIYLGISPISYKFTMGKNYNIKITKENYKPINETIFITENVNKLPVYNLEKLEKILPIITEPTNATIEIDGKFIGISPISYKFTIGKNYNIKITKENYKPINETIFITENINKLPVYNLEKLEKILPIITEPSNARIYIDDNYIGISPIYYNFTIGKNYNIKITKENYKPINETIFITENVYKLPVYNLEKLITEKTLTIITEPSNARIDIDGFYIGISPIGYKFTIGKNYNIKITKENYKPINETIFITENVYKLPVYNLEENIVLPKIEMVFVQGGTFTMGCTDEQGSDCER